MENQWVYQRILEAVPEGIWIVDTQGRTLFCTERMAGILGTDVESMAGGTCFDCVFPADLPEAQHQLALNLAGDAPPFDFRLRRGDGAAIWVSISCRPMYDDSDSIIGLLGLFTDITERKRAEATLFESEERLKSAQRLSHVGNWEWDGGSARMRLSEEICRIFGQPLKYAPDLAGFLQAVHPQDRERVEQLIRGSIAGKEWTEVLEFQIIRPDGDVRTITCNAEIMRDSVGVPMRIFGACQDVTDQRRTEVSLRRNLDELAHVNRVAAIGELAAALAHELNQPLAAILINAQAAAGFLGDQRPDIARVHECLTDIIADDKRAGEVIARLREMLRKGQSRASPVHLNDVVGEAARLAGSEALLRDVAVKIEKNTTLPPVLGDRVQLCQVVLNLIVNGLDAAAEQPPGNRWVLVRTAQSDDDGVELTVEDSGKGIAADAMGRLFEPFFSTKQKGLGMGLSISRSIVQAHGGRIWAENVAGRGGVFRCSLPAAQPTAEATKNAFA